MKIAINISRENLAGISSTNRNLLDYLHGSNITFVGIELNQNRSFKSPVMYRHLCPNWFNHQIISICDYELGKVMKKARSLEEVEKFFAPIIKEVQIILKKEKPDAIIINGTYYIPWIISIAAAREKIPLILWYAGVLTCEVEYYKPNQRKIFQNMERSIVRRAQKIIFPSKICQNKVFEKVSKADKVKNGIVIPNPISHIFTQTKQIEKGVEGQIAFIGRDSPVKNLDTFCKLHLALKRAGWKHEATLVSNVNKKRKNKIPKSITIVPSMSADELKTFYTTQGLIISPSHFETFGNVPIEAVCLGIPVLVSSNMGCAEILNRAKLENMVIDFTNIPIAVKRVMELCGQYVLPKQINNLRKQVDTKYVAQKIISVIKSLPNLNGLRF